MAVRTPTIYQEALDSIMKNDSCQSFEDIVRYYGWDESLAALLRPLPRSVIERYITEASAYDKDGWRYILPKLPSSASILCLDSRFGNTAAAFAETGASVTVIHPCPVTVRILQYRLGILKVPNIKIILAAPQTGQLPFANESFDAFIGHDVNGILHRNRAKESRFFPGLTATFLAEIYRVIKLDGFAYFGIVNRLSYSRIKEKWLARCKQNGALMLNGISIQRVMRTIKHIGFSNSDIYPYIVERGRVVEIIPNTGYRSMKNSFTISEKLKQIILGKIGLQYFAPAYGLVCVKGHSHTCQIRDFARNLTTENILAEIPETQPCFQRYLPMPGKVFITLGKAAIGDENILIVIPKIPDVLNWRRKEITIVNEARELSPYLASKLPSLYCELSWGGEAYFALSEIPGITIDRRVPHIHDLTRHAVEFLIWFNQITVRETVINQQIYADLVGSVIGQAVRIYPIISDIAGRIESLMRAALIGKSLSVVWFHGDYKLENLLIDRNTLEISGIIDWEQSRRHGLPWLDFLYLLTYNRIMIENRDFFTIYHEIIMAQYFEIHEKRFVDTYQLAMPITPELRLILISLFFIHHIGYRCRYNINIEGYRLKILHGLEEIKNQLTQLTL